MYFSSFGSWEVWDQSTKRFAVWWEPTSWFIECCLLAVSLQGERVRGSLWIFFLIRALFPKPGHSVSQPLKPLCPSSLLGLLSFVLKGIPLMWAEKIRVALGLLDSKSAFVGRVSIEYSGYFAYYFFSIHLESLAQNTLQPS